MEWIFGHWWGSLWSVYFSCWLARSSPSRRSSRSAAWPTTRLRIQSSKPRNGASGPVVDRPEIGRAAKGRDGHHEVAPPVADQALDVALLVAPATRQNRWARGSSSHGA